jgi:hypothetical protein
MFTEDILYRDNFCSEKACCTSSYNSFALVAQTDATWHRFRMTLHVTCFMLNAHPYVEDLRQVGRSMFLPESPTSNIQ